MPRNIAIGDVHGCALEFEALLQALDLKKGDRVIQVGDLINRGPDSHVAIELAREYKVEVILGNHELRLIRSRREMRPEILRTYDYATLKQLTEADWAYLETLPSYQHAPEIDTVFVHAGFLPDQIWHKQSIEITTHIQVIDANGRAAKRSDAPGAPAWANHWHGSPFVIYGHTARPKVYRRPGSIGIDTGCVYGGHLTAYILEDESFVQVRARKTYAHSKHMSGSV
jgi:diadenosine tetraphosphatase ApaH/serine/threonine PP2A family protein phosphatase